MLFSESQYRAWALLARYLPERHRLPRNFPLLPHALRRDLNRDAALFRRIVLADERAEVMMRVFAAAPFNIAESSFDLANAATLQAEYGALRVRRVAGVHREHNTAWKKYIEDDMFRGVQGHSYSGAIKRNKSGRPSDKTECPGPLFDFHRLARAVWDWWWYPFDVTDARRTDAPRRSYRHWDGDTPLLEYYFDESKTARNQRLVDGIHGAVSSPATFSMDSRSPIYALANGDLVAVRMPSPEDGISLAFVLVRHEVFHLERPPQPIPMAGHGDPWSLDYDQSPSYVYSLYMHLQRPANM